MERNFTLEKDQTGLLVIDVQDSLLKSVERSCETFHQIMKVVRGFQILQLPILVTEQYPEGLGKTTPGLAQCLGEGVEVYSKTTFSCLGDSVIREKILSSNVKQWVTIGIEAHVCLLQTAKDLISEGRQVVALNDATSSRSIYDYSTAVAELRDCGVRISNVETVLFELLRDSKAPEFKQISALVK